MASFALEDLRLFSMASEHLCLNLTKARSWDDFPAFARTLISFLHADVINKAESVEMRIWHLQLAKSTVRLVHDDFPLMVTLESDSLDGDEELKTIAENFKLNKEI